LSNIDDIVTAIKAAVDPAAAKAALLGKKWAAPVVAQMLAGTKLGRDLTRPEDMLGEFGLEANGTYQLSEAQAQEILQLRLQRLTGLEQNKIVAEFKEVLANIEDLVDIIASEARVTAICKQELESVRDEFGDERKSEIVLGVFDIEDEDLIPRRDVMVTFSHMGYIKRSDLDEQTSQRRGGRGKAATDLKVADGVSKMFVANSHDILMCFTSAGRALPVKVYALPEGSRHSRGRPLVNYLNLQKGEVIAELLPISAFDEDYKLVFASKLGMVKRTLLSDFKTIRAGGLIALDLNPGDKLVSVSKTNGLGDLMLFTNTNRVNRFAEPSLRTLSRTAKGVRCMRLAEGEWIIGMLAPQNDQETLFTVTEFGYAKRTTVENYRKATRGSVGVKAIPSDERIGNLMKVMVLPEGKDVMGITNAGVMIRVSSDEVRKTSRMAKGVRLLKLDEGQWLVDVCVADEQPVDIATSDAVDTDELDTSEQNDE
jgi:DNA gyrase subunit A